MKKAITIFLIGSLIVTILPWFIFPALNNIKAYMLKQKMEEDPLPPNTQIVESLSDCGNTSGTGNHTEAWAAILIKSDLSEDEINNFYGDAAQNILTCGGTTDAMELLGKEFVSLENATNYDDYYIVERTDNAVSSFFDIRGH